MSIVDTAMRTTHLLVAALWTGSVLFVAVGVLPVARDGDANAAPLERIIGRLTSISRVSSVLMLATGGHLAAQGYTVDSLLGSTRGHLVLSMLALWLVLTAFVEIGASRMTAGFQGKKVRSPARDHGRWFQAAALVGVLLLVDAGLLTTGIPAL